MKPRLGSKIYVFTDPSCLSSRHLISHRMPQIKILISQTCFARVFSSAVFDCSVLSGMRRTRVRVPSISQSYLYCVKFLPILHLGHLYPSQPHALRRLLPPSPTDASLLSVFPAFSLLSPTKVQMDNTLCLKALQTLSW